MSYKSAHVNENCRNMCPTKVHVSLHWSLHAIIACRLRCKGIHAQHTHSPITFWSGGLDLHQHGMLVKVENLVCLQILC